LAEINVNLIVVDHLPCENNELGLCTGVIRQGVSDFGQSLAHYVRLPRDKYGDVAAVFCSTLPRATESAQLCFGQLGVPIISDPLLGAIDYGDYHLSSMERILEMQNSYMYDRFPGGESYADMVERYRSFFDEKQVRFEGQAAIVVGHYGTREILTHLCSGVPLHLTFSRRARATTTKDRKTIIEERVAKAEYAVFHYVAGSPAGDNHEDNRETQER
jgi:broad specificity phosphatase PhoE